jgi:RNase P protein component
MEISQQLPEKKALSLIYYDNEEGFKVSDEAKDFLMSIKEKIGVIVVAGKYRTGKSFLLNRIILGKMNEGFGVGPTINPCTKGLWVWNEIVETEYNGEKLKVLIIDSEGIGAFDEDQNHDTKIFLFALLLSSYFIYNSMGTIDENAINNLSLIINLSKNLHVQADQKAEEDPDELAKYFPRFLWVLRDFSLKLRDEYDNQITPKEYFENALNPQKGISEKVESRNRIRRLIRHFFTDRDCATLVRPTEEETDLQALQLIPDENLRPEFVEAAKKLKNKIFKKVKPKTLNGKFITGEMLLELCHSYAKAINQGSVPSIKNAWSYVCQNECQRAINESTLKYEKDMKEFLESAKKSQNINILEEGEENVREHSIASFKQKAVGGDLEEFERILRKELSKKFRDIKQEFNVF